MKIANCKGCGKVMQQKKTGLCIICYRKSVARVIHYCKTCGRELNGKNTTGFCIKCVGIIRTKPRPPCKYCGKPTLEANGKYHRDCFIEHSRKKYHPCLICGKHETPFKFCVHCNAKYRNRFDRYTLDQLVHYERHHFHWCTRHQHFYQGFCDMCKRDAKNIPKYVCICCGKMVSRRKRTCLECSEKRIKTQYKKKQNFAKIVVSP